VREPGSGTRAVFDHAFQQRQETPRIKLELSRQEAIKQSARAGLGVGCLSQLSVVDELASGVLVPLETTLNLTRRFSLLSLKAAAPTALVKEFLQFARQWTPQ
jgi:DNA-binding transcriptional LysR family regulator